MRNYRAKLVTTGWSEKACRKTINRLENTIRFANQRLQNSYKRDVECRFNYQSDYILKEIKDTEEVLLVWQERLRTLIINGY